MTIKNKNKTKTNKNEQIKTNKQTKTIKANPVEWGNLISKVTPLLDSNVQCLKKKKKNHKAHKESIAHSKEKNKSTATVPEKI